MHCKTTMPITHYKLWMGLFSPAPPEQMWTTLLSHCSAANSSLRFLSANKSKTALYSFYKRSAGRFCFFYFKRSVVTALMTAPQNLNLHTDIPRVILSPSCHLAEIQAISPRPNPLQLYKIMLFSKLSLIYFTMLSFIWKQKNQSKFHFRPNGDFSRYNLGKNAHLQRKQ